MPRKLLCCLCFSDGTSLHQIPLKLLFQMEGESWGISYTAEISSIQRMRAPARTGRAQSQADDTCLLSWASNSAWTVLPARRPARLESSWPKPADPGTAPKWAMPCHAAHHICAVVSVLVMREVRPYSASEVQYIFWFCCLALIYSPLCYLEWHAPLSDFARMVFWHGCS